MSEQDLSTRFPEMTPISGAPSLYTVNGIGVGLYGKRDHDAETNTYVATYALCVLFVPILALKAYRLARVGSSQIAFLGRVPLSGFARSWNLLLVAAILYFGFKGWWGMHTSSPEYVARQNLERAAELEKSGKLAESARVLLEVELAGPEDERKTARDRFARILGAPLDRLGAADALELMTLARDWRRRSHRTPLPPAELGSRLRATAERFLQDDPGTALAVLSLAAEMELGDFAPLRRRALERLVQTRPDHVEGVGELAVLLEAEGNLERCGQILAPLAKSLGANEGARILGLIYSSQGKYEEAFPLLDAYVSERLGKLHEAEKAYASAFERSQGRFIAKLNQGGGPADFYSRYEAAATPEAKESIVNEYLLAALSTDPDVAEARAALEAASAVVPVALDLAIVRLGRAHSMPGPEEKARELAAAETVFLAVQGVAGESDAYRIGLGQVYYWLGRHAEGRTLFDEFLAAKERAPEMLIHVATVLREVGEVAAAREMLEEAYTAAMEGPEKSRSAALLAILTDDLDKKLEWLTLANSSEPAGKAEFLSVEGQIAFRDGRDEEAASKFTKAIELYASIPEDSTILNNAAIIHGRLHTLTGDPRDFRKSIELFEKAILLEPGNSILLSNVGSMISADAALDLVQGRIELGALHRWAGLDLLSFLYADEAERQPILDRLRAHPRVAQAQTLLERTLVLAPRSPNAYGQLATLLAYARDEEGLATFAAKLRAVELDQSELAANAQEQFAPELPARLGQEARTLIDRSRGRLASARENPGGVTFAVAVAAYLDASIGASMLDVPVDADELVRLAEEAVRVARSSATHGALRKALLFRAGKTLEAEEEAFRAMAKRARRSVSPVDLIWFALSRSDDLSARVLANQDMKRLAELVRESGLAFPNDRDTTQWLFLLHTNPEEAMGVAKSIAADEVGGHIREIWTRLHPFSPMVALTASLARRLEGDDAGARQLLEDLAKRGVPLPFDP